MAGQPGDGLDVEVVGGLVEEHDVVIAHQDLRQRDPAPLPARQRPQARVPAQVAQQPGDDVADLRIPSPLVFGDIPDDGVPHGLLVVEVVTLIQDADPDAAAHRDAPGIGLPSPREQVEQARLAVAVATDDADAVALVHAKRDRVEHDLGREVEVEGFSPQKVRH
jgi:hypothetical protein